MPIAAVPAVDEQMQLHRLECPSSAFPKRQFGHCLIAHALPGQARIRPELDVYPTGPRYRPLAVAV